MSIPISNMISQIDPQNTVLFFGAGSSIPSGAPSVGRIISEISKKFGIVADDFSLPEISSLAERKGNRRQLIDTLRGLLKYQVQLAVFSIYRYIAGKTSILRIMMI